MFGFLRKFIPDFLIGWYHFCLAFLGALIYGFPSRKLKVIGITGTQGKSTVVELCAKILEQAGCKIASLSSIKFSIGQKEWPNTLKMTMPGRFRLQKFLRQAVKNGCQYAVLEVTSEGILQHRHKFIDFDVVVFTNLSPEHIERHGSFEKYRQAKGKLFKSCSKIHIINLDDKNSEYFLKFPAKKKYTYGLEKGDINAKNTQFKINLLGEFNIYNSLAAICVGLSQGIDLEICKIALEKIKGIPGRMEIVVKEPFTVIVDYAHTPDALQKVYQTITENREQRTENSMICVLGSAGGGRDKWKRPVLGKIAKQYCDKIILTNEDPYDENPLQILDEIGLTFEKILDRREAIRKALSLAKPGDTVIITGKGCEPWLCAAKGKKIPWDDRKIVREEFDKLKL